MKTNRINRIASLAAILVAGSSASLNAASALVNGGFETYSVTGQTWVYGDLDGSGWQTTEPGIPVPSFSVGAIEVWGPGNVLGLPAAQGNTFAEINAFTAASLYQNVTIDMAGSVGYYFDHRGRVGTDTLKVTITYFGLDNTFGTGDDSVMVDTNFSAGNTAWETNIVSNAFTSVADGKYRFAYSAVSSTGPDNSYGNFIDAVGFGVGVPEPSAALLSGLGLMFFLRRKR
jgi:hypothetical protein